MNRLALSLNCLSCAQEGPPPVPRQHLKVHLVVLNETRDVPHSMAWHLSFIHSVRLPKRGTLFHYHLPSFLSSQLFTISRMRLSLVGFSYYENNEHQLHSQENGQTPNPRWLESQRASGVVMLVVWDSREIKIWYIIFFPDIHVLILTWKDIYIYIYIIFNFRKRKKKNRSSQPSPNHSATQRIFYHLFFRKKKIIFSFFSFFIFLNFEGI
jgi:hypothetical protein